MSLLSMEEARERCKSRTILFDVIISTKKEGSKNFDYLFLWIELFDILIIFKLVTFIFI